MKYFFALWSLTVLSCPLSAQKIVSADLQAAGLTCAMCSNAIQKSLQTLSFIESVDADLQKSSFHIQFRDSENISVQLLRDRVEDAGFSIASLKVKVNSEGKSIVRGRSLYLGRQQFCILEKGNVQSVSSFDILILHKGFMTDKKFKQYSKANQGTQCVIVDQKDIPLYYAILQE